MNTESSKVQLIRKQFEILSKTEDDITVVSSNRKKPVFQRSKTSINLVTTAASDNNKSINVNSDKKEVNHGKILRSVNITNNKSPKQLLRQTDDLKRASIKRSQAFRRPAKVQSPGEISRKSESPEIDQGNLTDTLKKALKQPLPKGPPPRKPKRTFETDIEQLVNLDNTEKQSKNSTFSSTNNKHLNIAETKSEPIYTTPCINHVSSECKHVSKDDLHYMCTLVKDTNGSEHNWDNRDTSTYDEIKILVGAAYAKPEITEKQEPTSVTKLARRLTEQRKDYVRRTASRKHEYRKTISSLYNNNSKRNINDDDVDEVCNIEPVRERLNKYKQLIEANSEHDSHQDATPISKNKQKINKNITRNNKLFITCCLVGFDITKKVPYIKWNYPSCEIVPDNLEELVFPSNKLVFEHNLSNQTYIQIITNLDGSRIYAYCRRVLPEGPNKVLLPLAYCMVTETLLPNFYFSILEELESRHGQSEIVVKSIMENLYNQNLPAPGEQLKCSNVKQISNSSIKPPIKYPRRLSLENYPQWMNGKDEYIFMIKRPSDPRLEHTEISKLFNILGTELLITVFSTLLLERKVILLSSNINSLSTCIIALERILYPFTWLFPQIVCLPDHIINMCEAPFPLLTGCFCNFHNFHMEIQNGIVVDLDAKLLIHACGDEKTILPDDLMKSLTKSLKLVTILDESSNLSSALIAEGFLRFFVELLSQFDITNFDKRDFIESQTSASKKLFLEWFTETTMFQHFLNTQQTEKQLYQIFFLKLKERSQTIHKSFHNIEALIKNCHIINKKPNTYYNRLKSLFS